MRGDPADKARRTMRAVTAAGARSATSMSSVKREQHRQRVAAFFERFGRHPIRGLPKYAVLREAIAGAIEHGYWKIGEKLPTEAELVRCTPFSLGTVQRALRSLVEEGIVTRAQGSGSFVSESRQQMEAPWHCRFLDADGRAFLPVYPKLLSRRRIARKGAWSAYVAPGGDAVIQIDRRLGIGDEFFVYSRLYMNAARFGSLLTKSVREIEGANLKAVIGRDFHLPITQIGQRVLLARFPVDICRAIHVGTGTMGLFMECVATARAGFNVYYQELYVPPNEHRLLVSDSNAAWSVPHAVEATA